MENGRHITVLGVGRAGIRILNELAKTPSAAGLRLLALDTDQETLESCNVPQENKLLAGFAWREGHGCGGNTLLGQRAVAEERPRLETFLNGSELLFITGGLGGGTASPAMGILNSVARKFKIPTLFFVTVPFVLEGHSKRNVAERVLSDDLLALADAVFALPNDLLFSVLPSTAPLKEGFRMSDEQVARAILSVGMAFGGANVLPADFEDLVSLLRRRKSYCSIGVGVGNPADGQDRCSAALERMLHSPLLGGSEKINEADALVVSLLGGENLQLGEARQLLETTVKMSNPNAQTTVSVSTLPELGESVQLCVAAIKFDNSGEVRKTTEALLRGPKPRADKPVENAEQPLLFPQDDQNCGVMEKTIPVVVNGQNLDIPTFRRRKLEIIHSIGQ